MEITALEQKVQPHKCSKSCRYLKKKFGWLLSGSKSRVNIWIRLCS